MLLVGTRQKTWYVYEGENRNIECITETDEPSGFIGRIHIQTPGFVPGLIGDDTDVWLCDKGNAGMATGGMGDVLTGIIAGFGANGYALALEAALELIAKG